MRAQARLKPNVSMRGGRVRASVNGRMQMQLVVVLPVVVEVVMEVEVEGTSSVGGLERLALALGLRLGRTNGKARN